MAHNQISNQKILTTKLETSNLTSQSTSYSNTVPNNSNIETQPTNK